MKYKMSLMGLLLLIFVLSGNNIKAEVNQPQKPVKMTAETIDYDSKSGEVVANGKVRVEQGADWLTCDKATYNNVTGNGTLVGKVLGKYGDITIKADRVEMRAQKYITCFGAPVIITQLDKRFIGPQVYYDDLNKYVEAPYRSTVFMSGSELTGDRMQGWLDKNHVIVTGNVYGQNVTQQAEMWCGRAEYFGLPKDKDGKEIRLPGQQPKLVLTIEPHGKQANNELSGDIMTMYLDDSAADVDGHAKAVLNN